MVLGRNPSYWDARHVYLQRWTLVDSPDPSASYQGVIEDTMQGASFQAITTQPSVLYLAGRNHNITDRSTPDVDYSYLALDAAKSPFTDQRAREALDYCTDREAIAKGKDVFSGYASPAYVLAGSASAYLASWRCAGRGDLDAVQVQRRAGNGAGQPARWG